MSLPDLSMSGTAAFLAQHALLAYPVLFFGSYFETLIGVGFFVYGEIFFIPGAILAGTGVLNIYFVCGDSSSYAIGYHYGTRIFKPGRRFFNPENRQKGTDFFKKHGNKAVFLARIMGPVSWITPFLAGTYKMPYRTFVAYNIPGATVGIGGYIIAGYFFGNNITAIWQLVARYDDIVFGAVAVLVIGFLVWRYLLKRKASN